MDLVRQDDKPNNSIYLEGPSPGKYAVYVFFSKEELDVLVAAAGKKNIAKYIRDLVLEEVGIDDI
jgi:hypothetical protein